MEKDTADATLNTIEHAASKFESLMEPSGPTEYDDNDEQDEAEFDEDEATDEDSSDTQDTDEDEGDEPEDEADEEDESTDDEDADEVDIDPNKTYVVRNKDGSIEKIKGTEYRDGILRQADYSRKTAALAEERKSFGQEVAQVRQEREQYVAVINAHQANLEQGAPNLTAEQWAWLKANDPIEYHNRKDDLNIRQEQWQQMEQQKAWIAEQQKLNDERELGEMVASQRAILEEKFPELRDPRVWKKTVADCRKAAKALGYEDEDVSGIVDHRTFIALMKLAPQMKVQTSKAQVERKALPPVKQMAPGAAQPTRNRQNTELRKSKERLAKSGSISDAAAVFDRLL